MSQKTDTPEFARGFLWQIVLLTIVAMSLVLVSHGTLSWNLTSGSQWEGVSVPITLYPWVYGGGRTIANGLRAFSGQSPVMAPIALRAATLMLVLISMVVCPTLFLLEWRRRRLKDEAAAGRPPLKISGILYSLCGWITIVSGIGLFPVAYVSETTQAGLRHAQAVQWNRDAMIDELNFLSVDAAQYYILPKSIGGGGRSFEGYAAPAKFAKTEKAVYTVTEGKNTASIHAVSLRDPSCTIDVRIDSLGQMGGWAYGGEFR